MDRKRRYLFDLDDTIGFMWKRTAQLANERYGDNFKFDSLADCPAWDFSFLSKAGEKVYEIWDDPNFYTDVEVLNGAQEVISRLNNQGHEIFIVTASFPFTLVNKNEWVKKYFPFLDWKNIIVCSAKHLVDGDVLFDDNHVHNLGPWQESHPHGLAVAMATGHNLDWEGPRVKNWLEFEALSNYWFEMNKMKQVESIIMGGDK